MGTLLFVGTGLSSWDIKVKDTLGFQSRMGGRQTIQTGMLVQSSYGYSESVRREKTGTTAHLV